MIHNKSAISINKLHIIFNKASFARLGGKGGSTMARRKRNLQFLAGLIAGVLIGFLVKICLKNAFVYNARSIELNGMLKCHRSSRRFGSIKAEEQFLLDPLKIIGHSHNETVHNSKRSLLFVGVMTAEKYLKTRANAVYRTWGKDLPGRIAFFSSEVSRSDSLPLVPLKGVDDSYPPQKKSFMMLLYMHDNFGDKFEWFLRADDDVYIKTDKLESLLRSVDSRRAQFIGQAGRGSNEEFGNLSLEYDENFCMGGPGVILSRETLKRVAPHIKECLKNLYTTHEDVELGRCVKKFAGVPCTWSYEMQSILYHNSSGSLAFTGNLKKQEVHHAITLHPVKDHKHMFRINTYLKNLKIQDLKLAAISLHQDILTSAEKLELHPKNLATHYIGDSVPLYPNYQGQREYLGDTSILGVSSSLNRYHPKEVNNVLHWNFISKAIFSPDNANPKRRMEVSTIESIEDNIRELMENINAYSKQRGRVIEFRELLYGYQRLDPIHGADYILDILLVYKKYRGRKMTVSVRRHAYLQQSFTGIEIRELPLGESPYTKPSKDTNILKVDHGFTNEDQADGLPFMNFKKINVPFKDAFQSSLMKISQKLPNVFGSPYNMHEGDKKHITFILPLSGRYETFVRFLNNYEEVCLKLDRQTTLIITLYKDIKHNSDFDRTKEAVERMNKKYQYSEIIIINMEDSQFSRGLSLEKGTELCNEDSLMLFIDVDISFNSESLQRIRLNTVQHYKVYFPIVFSEYDPEVVNGLSYNIIKTDVSEKSDIAIDRDYNNYWRSDNCGYYRQFGFGIVSVYKSDFVSVGGFNTDIKGWGLEDVHLFDKFIQSNVTIFRTVDPSLVHVYHPVDCDKNLDVAQYNMCTGTRANTLGSIKHMTIFLLNNPNVLIKTNTAKPKIIVKFVK